MGNQLPAWYYSPSGEEVSYVVLRYRPEYDGLDHRDDYIELFERFGVTVEQYPDKITWDDLFDVINLTSTIQVVVCYGEAAVLEFIEDHTYSSEDVIYQFYSSSPSIDYLLRLISIVEQHQVAFESLDGLIELMSKQPIIDWDKEFFHLVKSYVQISENEIKFFYHCPKSKIIRMTERYEPLRELLEQTIHNSEIIAKQYLRYVRRSAIRQTADQIDDRQFLLEYINDHSHNTIARYHVVESLVYRQMLTIDECIGMMTEIHTELFSSLDHNTEVQDMALFLLQQSLNRSTDKFASTYSLLSHWLNVDNVIDVVLRSGNTTDVIKYIEKTGSDLLMFMLPELQAILEPSDPEDNSDELDENII